MFIARALSLDTPAVSSGCTGSVLPEEACGRNFQGSFDSVTPFNGARIPPEGVHLGNTRFPSHVLSKTGILWASSSALFGLMAKAVWKMRR